MLSVHLVQMDLQKSFLACYTSSVWQDAGQSRGQAFHIDSEHLKDDWDRGITWSCLLSQDHEYL